MWTGTVGPFQGRSDSSDFYVEPQMYLILYTETDLHTVRMHESSCLSPISMVEMGEWVGDPGCHSRGSALASFLVPRPQDRPQPRTFHLGLQPSDGSPPLLDFLLHSGRLFWVAGTVFQSLGVIPARQPLTLGKGKKKKRTLDHIRWQLTSPAPQTAIRAILMSSVIISIYVLKRNQMMNKMIISVSAFPSLSPQKLALTLKSN